MTEDSEDIPTEAPVETPVDAAPVLTPLDDIPVRLSFATDSREIPLKDLYDLAPGALVSFDVAKLEAG